MKTQKIALLLGLGLIGLQIHAQDWELDGNTGTNPLIHFVGTTDAQPLIFRTNNIERMRIDQSGRVGIGTTTFGNTNTRLQVSGGNIFMDYAPDGNSGNLFFGDETDENTGNGLRLFAVNSGPSYIDCRSSVATDGLVLRVSTTSGHIERMRICANGNIGMGTFQPLHRLHVNGDLFVTGGTSNTAGLLLGDVNTQPQYGIEYMDPATGVSGMNFWKPWNSTNGAGNQGFQNYIMFLNDDGNVGIGVTPDKIDPLYKLSVNGSVRATEVVVETGWADFVFEPDYRLMPLTELENYIKENSHLPDVPSATEVENNGVSVGKMESTLLQKIEELTLYVIDQNKKIEQLQSELNSIKGQEQK